MRCAELWNRPARNSSTTACGAEREAPEEVEARSCSRWPEIAERSAALLKDAPPFTEDDLYDENGLVIAADTSALISILLNEPEAADVQAMPAATTVTCMSAVSLQEASMVLAGRLGDKDPWRELEELIAKARIEIVPHDADLARIARDAFLRFGKGRHPARLNCGDCASYALASHRRIPLLFKGDDFARTDITVALPAS